MIVILDWGIRSHVIPDWEIRSHGCAHFLSLYNVRIMKTMILFLFILIVVAVILILLCIFYHMKQVNNVPFIFSPVIESFSMESPANLLKNGDFKNGLEMTNIVNRHGFSKIIQKQNPLGASLPYVMLLGEKKKDSFLQLVCSSDKNNKYRMSFWFSLLDEGIFPIDELDFEKMIRVKIRNNDNRTYDIPRLTYNIIQKTDLGNLGNSGNSGDVWYRIEYEYVSGPITLDSMQVFVHSIGKVIAFTGFELYKVLLEAPNFVHNGGLLSYTDGYKYQTIDERWEDISGNANDLFWKTIPSSDLTTGGLQIQPSKLEGFPSNVLPNDGFTAFFILHKNEKEHNIDADINSGFDSIDGDPLLKKLIDDQYLLSMTGNERFSFELLLRENRLVLVVDGKEFPASHETMMYSKTSLALLYDGKRMRVLCDGISVIDTPLRKMYFNKNRFLVNKNKNMNYTLYAILFYGRILSSSEIKDIGAYFLENQNKHPSSSGGTDINRFLMENYMDEKKVSESVPTTYKPYNKRENLNDIPDTFQNGKDDMENMNGADMNKTNSCPSVYMKNGQYCVFISPNSPYSQQLNYHGEKMYGTNQEKAKITYQTNFPACPIPPELLPAGGKPHNESCPFIIHDGNPCSMQACGNVEWNMDTPQKMNLSKKCKTAVSAYCRMNYELDEKCKAWNPTNTEKNIVKVFEDAKEYCDPAGFNIEDHPDFAKYIRKDSIPCYGCTLD